MEIIEFEVIADYPGQLFAKGEMISVYEKNCTAYIIEEGKYDLRDFPALFKRVE